jgi:serine/threonine protein kinase
MTTRRNDKTAAPPPKDQEGSAKPDLLTSEDLFGEMVDAPPARARNEAKAAPSRKGPIKVQVSEPGAPRKSSPLASSPGSERLPEDVAALLDAFSEPAESALREEAELDTVPPEASELDELIDEAPGKSAAEAAPGPAGPGEADARRQGVRGGTPLESPVPVTPADEDDEDLLREVLEASAGQAPAVSRLPRPAPPRAAAPTRAVSARDEEAESVRELLDLRRSLPVSTANEVDEVVKPTSRTSTKFKAAAPKKDAPAAGAGLDLAALAEDAFTTADAPVPAAAPAEVAAAAAAPPAEGPALDAGAPPDASPATAEAAAAEPGQGGTRDYGPYRLLERVAVGGMAEVFRAKRTGVEGFEKVVAVKRILSHLSDNKEFVDMFVDEAKMVGGLAHPNIVQIFDLGKLEKNYYIAMEYVHGRDLRTILRRARERSLRIPLDISTYVVSKVCAALEYAHRKKDDRGQPMLIVHRDISPQNILISFEGDVKLTDFGIAKAATKASTTDKGALRGKLLYMSPEQAWGKPMDKRSDVFSLGIVFYEMLTQQKPFLGTSEMSILETVRECRVPPPTTLNDKIPEKLERVVMKSLERDPEVRYQDAGEMLRDLERVLHEWQPATATGLARFLEILFDEHERGDSVAGEGAGEHSTGPGAGLEMESHEPASGPAPPEAPPPARAKDPMSIQKLLKRFGIK